MSFKRMWISFLWWVIISYWIQICFALMQKIVSAYGGDITCIVYSWDWGNSVQAQRGLWHGTSSNRYQDTIICRGGNIDVVDKTCGSESVTSRWTFPIGSVREHRERRQFSSQEHRCDVGLSLSSVRIIVGRWEDRQWETASVVERSTMQRKTAGV